MIQTLKSEFISQGQLVVIFDLPPVNFHKWKTLDNKYVLGDEIEEGVYGRVYKGLDLETGDFVAIKQFSLECIDEESVNTIMLCFLSRL